MSLATRCTHCGTIFKVVQDQLKVSEGWVRCGRCNEVFNALPALFDLEKDPPPPRPAHLSEPPAAAVAAVAPDTPEPSEIVSAPITPPPAPVEDAAEPISLPETAAEAAPESLPPPAAFRAGAGMATGVPIPLTAMPNVHQPPPERNALAEQGLIADADVDLGFDSKPPSGWAQTQPADIAQHELDASDLALDPTPIEATTDFELDTSIAVDDNTPLEAVLASMSPRQAPTAAHPPSPEPAYAPEPPPMAPLHTDVANEGLSLRITPSPSPWLDEPPEDVPSTEEEDALDSRYLMPSPSRDRKPQRRREDGPEFVDAQFPSDAFIDAEEDWASDFGPSALDADAPIPAAAPPRAATPAGAATDAPMSGLRGAGDAPPDSRSFSESFAPEEDNGSKPQRKGRGKQAGASDEPEFLKHAQRKAFWRHPAMRAMLSVLLLSLLATLALQLTHQFRDLIAAHHPASRPLLAHLCDLAHCEIKPPLRIEDLQVESAALVRAASEGPDSYRLAVVVHNRASIDLAWPHIDLTLTDDNGAVIARRVFSPADAQWLDTADPKAEAPANGTAESAASATPAAVPGQRSTTLQWRLLAPDIKPAGYTAELFYP